ncbi:MAG: transketolase family protein [Deltaproteobacteria bacterium]|nr:transketolase family protein [Deltaproteobacteria bacterium]
MAELFGIRDAYGETLVQLAGENRDIVALDADLSGSTMSKLFAQKFPERFFNMGIAEQDMVATAAGLSLAGKIAFASTFAVFAAGRAWEQIRQAVAYPQTNVKIVASHGGISVGEDGASHQMTEDIAIMRALPNMRVLVPADALEMRAIIKFAAREQGPFYIRSSRMKFPLVYQREPDFRLGKADVLREGDAVAIFATGAMVFESLQAAEALSHKGISCSVINISSLKPLAEETIIACASKVKKVVTVEEHSIIGGLGSAIAEVLSEHCPRPLQRLGVRDKFCSSGTSQSLFEHCGLTATAIVQSLS